MEHGILTFLRSADKTMAWAAAVALAAGGTALFVAFYLQWQRWRTAAAARRDARRAAAVAGRSRTVAAAKTAAKPTRGAPVTVAPATGVAAYRQQANPGREPVPAAAAVAETPAPSVPAPPAPRLDPLLARLQDAGDRLEELVRRHTSRSHEQDDMARLAAAIDVEFLHKQA
ncbi:MAG: hypothetical protein IPH09_02395 [bacterium]|nr:hypothetical protein [bacterium]